MSLTATHLQLMSEVTATPEDIVERYRRNAHWQLWEKEFIYRKFPPAGRSWVDFGCGSGEITTQLALLGASKVIGIDVTPGLLEITQRRAELDGVADRVKVACGLIQDLEPEPVDIVLAYAVLHHLPDHLDEAMKVIKRWLKPGGIFICSEPVNYMQALHWLRERSGVHMDPVDEGERKLTEADLQVIERNFVRTERMHFRGIARLERLWPGGAKVLRTMDRGMFAIPGTKALAGVSVLACYTD